MATTIGIFAHVDAGKTSLSEQILYQTGALRTLGRVDEKNTSLDHDGIERARGITIFSDEAPFQIGQQSFFLIDTPGHADFGGEMERSMCAIDCAILVISAVEGVQSHTRTIWKLLRKNQIPTIIFLNKIDRMGANPKEIIAWIQKKWSSCAIPFEGNQERVREELATIHESLLDAYLDESPAFWSLVRSTILKSQCFPILCGSALRGEGMDALLTLLEKLCYTPMQADGPFCARVYKVRHEKTGGRVTFLKILRGTLHTRDLIQTVGGAYKAQELRRFFGGKSRAIAQASVGELVAVYGLTDAMPGDIVGEGASRDTTFVLTPLLSVRVDYPKEITDVEMMRILQEIADEEPLYRVKYMEELHEIHIHIMGEIQLEILQNLLLERYAISVTFGECNVLYQETIAEPVMGCGHFEPLRHYAEVHLRIEPAPRGSGISFTSECSTDELALNWQRLIETHVLEKTHCGVLIGAPLCDVRIVLVAARAHLKHTEGGDFREATYRAIRQGLMQAKNILLEPWLSFEIEVEIGYFGRVLTDIQNQNGIYEAPEAEGENMILTGRAPAKALTSYAKELQIITGGHARISLAFDAYYPCVHQEEIITAYDYDPERDIKNTPDSVFCSHGAGYSVKWYDAPKRMHCILPKE